MCLQIMPDLRVVVRAPIRMAQYRIEQFVQEKSAWINKHLEQAKARRQNALPPLSIEQKNQLKTDAKAYLSDCTAKYAAVMNVTYSGIRLGFQRTRWGSCSSKGMLSFNCLLMLCPPQVRDYVVVHELSHRKEMNHSARFWAIVERYVPDYKLCRKWLRTNGQALMSRI